MFGSCGQLDVIDYKRASGRGAAWLARLLGVQEVPGSNPGGPTSFQNSASEHTYIEFKPLRSPELDFCKVRMLGVQQHIPFPANCCRGRKQHGALTALNPLISEFPQRFASRFVPTRRKKSWIEFAKRKRIGDFAFDRHKVRWYEFWLQIHKRFDCRER